MTKLRATLLALSTLVVGLAIGGWIGFKLWQHVNAGFIEAAYELRLVSDARTRVAALKAIRSSNDERAISLLEQLLDGDIIGMSTSLDSSAEPRKLRDTLAQVARDRQNTTYASSEPTVAHAVSSALKPFHQPE